MADVNQMMLIDQEVPTREARTARPRVAEVGGYLPEASAQVLGGIDPSSMKCPFQDDGSGGKKSCSKTVEGKAPLCTLWAPARAASSRATVHQGLDHLDVICPHRLKVDNVIFEDALLDLAVRNGIDTNTHEPFLSAEPAVGKHGHTVGNLDYAFGWRIPAGLPVVKAGLEIQTVYTTGRGTSDIFADIRRAWEEDPMWPALHAALAPNGLGADYRSSDVKRLVPQIISKGTILAAWDMDIYIVVHERFYEQRLREAVLQAAEKDREEASQASPKRTVRWMVYGFQDCHGNPAQLPQAARIESGFDAACGSPWTLARKSIESVSIESLIYALAQNKDIDRDAFEMAVERKAKVFKFGNRLIPTAY